MGRGCSKSLVRDAHLPALGLVLSHKWGEKVEMPVRNQFMATWRASRDRNYCLKSWAC